MSPGLHLYLAFSRVSGPIWRAALRRRLTRGKETPERLPEKLGVYKFARPEGTALWFHALSVGESLALLPLIEMALTQRPDAHVVLTTSTSASAAALSKAGLPDRCHHVLAPIDTVRAVRAFLDHWSPDVAAFAELDFWPRLMVETHRRGIPMVLVNSRMPEKNFSHRHRIAGITRDLIQMFGHLLVQDVESRERFIALGAHPEDVEVAGVLKSVARPLPADEAELEALRNKIAGRRVWLAAATWSTEHQIVAEAHEMVRRNVPGALLIVAPRQPKDFDRAEADFQARFAHVSRRSRGEPISAETEVYLADSIGEMGLWYRLAPISFIGHSLDPADEGLEGKNPFEAAALGSAILHGPNVSYFAESYDALTRAGAAREVESATHLAEAVTELQNGRDRVIMTNSARAVIAARSNVLDISWDTIEARIPD